MSEAKQEGTKPNVPKLRFPGFTDPWEQRKLGDIARRVTRKNEACESNLPLTISAQHGLVDQRLFFNKQVASKDLSGYYLLRKGEYAYNKSTSADSPWGAVKRLTRYEKGCVSTLYICFELVGAAPSWVSAYYETERWHKGICAIATEGARNHGLLNVSPSDFFQTQLKIPHALEEQLLIGAFFSDIDHLIALRQRELEDTKRLKKSLLQKMFPKEGSDVPEIRFPGFTDPWEQRKLGDVANTFSGGTPPVNNNNYYGGTIPFIRSAEIATDKTELYLTNEGLRNSSAKLVSKGTVLYALYGATSGEVAISQIDGAINQAILAIISELDNEFLLSLLRREKARIIETYLQGGQGNLSGTIVKNLILPMPSLPEQHLIGAFFRDVDDLITLRQRELEDTKRLKKALLQQMFV